MLNYITAYDDAIAQACYYTAKTHRMRFIIHIFIGEIMSIHFGPITIPNSETKTTSSDINTTCGYTLTLEEQQICIAAAAMNYAAGGGYRSPGGYASDYLYEKYKDDPYGNPDSLMEARDEVSMLTDLGFENGNKQYKIGTNGERILLSPMETLKLVSNDIVGWGGTLSEKEIRQYVRDGFKTLATESSKNINLQRKNDSGSADKKVTEGKSVVPFKAVGKTSDGKIILQDMRPDAKKKETEITPESSFWGGLWNGIKNTVSKAGECISTAAGVVSETISDIGECIQEKASAAAQYAANTTLKQAIADGIAAAKSSKIVSAITDIKDTVVEGAASAMSTIRFLPEAIVDIGKDLGAQAKNIHETVTENVSNALKSAAIAYCSLEESASRFVRNGILKAKNKVGEIPDEISEKINETADLIKDNIVANAVHSVRNCTRVVKDWLENEEYADWVLDGLDNVKSEFIDNVSNGMDVIINGTAVDPYIVQWWNDFWSAFEGTEEDRKGALDMMYREFQRSANYAALACYADESQQLMDADNKATPASGHYENSKTGTTNVPESSMNNAIMDAICPYLPAKYRDVDHLQSIPADVMKDACDKMEEALKNDTDSTLSASDRERIMNIMWLSSGLGGYYNQLQTFMTSLNRFGSMNVTPASEHVGLTFITRPRLCMQSSNIRNNRILTTLDTLNNSTMAFAIRCLLDSNFANANNGLYRSYVATSPIFDQQNPFFVPLCNALTGFSGSPDVDLESTTTDGGYMSEAQTFAIGGSNLQRGSYTLNLNFTEVAHNPVMAIFYYWLEYMRCVTRGSLMAYADDIDAQRLNYTVSIYRFLLDPTHRYITKYAKYTGCYPTGLPIGSSFNFNQGDVEVNNKNISITFNCNKVEYMDYAILMDFNTLMRRYCPDINKGTKTVTRTRSKWKTVYVPTTYSYNGVVRTRIVERQIQEMEEYQAQEDVEHMSPDDDGKIQVGYTMKCPALPLEALSNFQGLPYIVSDRNGYRLEFRKHPSPAFNRKSTTLADQLLYLDMITRLSKEVSDYDTITNLYNPEYYSAAKNMKDADLGEFIRRAFNKAASSDTSDPI